MIDSIWAMSWENLSHVICNNKGADQKAQISLHIHTVWSAPLLFAA